MSSPIPSLTGLRFLAAACVLVSHSIGFLLPFPNGEPDWHLYFRALAGIGMPLFFVLSGFVIHYNYSAQIEKLHTRGVVNFFIARFARLYPLFLACLAFDLVVKYSNHQLPEATLQALPYYLTLTQSWLFLPMGEHTIIFVFGVMPQVSWSISTEWFFYCLYPVIWILLRRLQTTRQVIVAISIVVIVSIAVVAALGLLEPFINAAATKAFGPIATARKSESFYFWFIYFSPYVRLSEFLLGCLCAALFLRTRGQSPGPFERRIALILSVGAVLGMAWLVWFFYVRLRAFDFETNLPTAGGVATAFSYCFGFAPLIAIFMFCCARYKNAIVSFLSGPNIVLCGEASYSLYMLHLMVIYAFRYTVSPVTSFEVGIGNALMWILTAASAVGLSIVSWKCLEMPARKWIRRAFLSNQLSKVCASKNA